MADRLRRLDLAQMRSERVRRLHEYWRAKAGAPASVPQRRDIDPTELPDLLPSLLLVDVEHNPLRFRYRLVGTRIVDFSYRDFTGTYLDEAGWAEEKGSTRAYTDAVTRAATDRRLLRLGASFRRARHLRVRAVPAQRRTGRDQPRARDRGLRFPAARYRLGQMY